MNQTYEYETINIYPSVVSSSSWLDAERALFNEQGDSSLYQEFNNTESAILDLRSHENSTSTIPLTSPESQTESPTNVDGETVLPVDSVTEPTSSSNEAVVGENENVRPSEESSEVNSEDMHVSGEGLPELIAPESPPTETEVEETITEPQSSESALEALSKSFFTFVAHARGIFSFAQESIITETPTSESPATEGEADVAPEEEVVSKENESENALSDVPQESQSSEEPTATEATGPNESLEQDAQSNPEEPLPVPADESPTPELGDGEGTQNEVESQANAAATPCEATCTPWILFEDFSVGGNYDDQHISNMQLRLSLGAQPGSNMKPGGYLRVEYEHYDYWMDGGVIPLDEETSNALNGGYFLFAFPLYSDWDELSRIKVRISYVGDMDDPPLIYLDGVWLEIEHIHNNALIDPEAMPGREVASDDVDAELWTDAPSEYTVTRETPEVEFATEETPRFEFDIQKEEEEPPPQSLIERVGNEVLEFFGLAEVEQEPLPQKLDVTVVDDVMKDIAVVETHNDGSGFTIEVPLQREFTPGVHTMTLEVEDGDTVFYIEQEFSWGVLALNADKSVYLQGEEGYLQMGVLDDLGHTLCDAALSLSIVSPSGGNALLSTEEGSIHYGDECAGDTYTTSPDYDARYTFTELGEYTLTLTATTENGVHTITDTIEVRGSVPFDVVRKGPTRIYPVEPYPMRLTITANEPYTGEVVELVPVRYQILDANKPFKTHEVGDAKQIIFNVNLEAGETTTFSYTFDAPDDSPEFYLLGPLTLGVWSEAREWQIAGDAPDNARIVQSVLGTEANATSYSATFGSAPTAGNTIIMVAMHRDGASAFTAPPFLSQAVLSNATVEEDIGIWYGSADPATSTYSISKTGGNQTGIVYLMEVTGLATTSLLNATSSNDQTGSTGLIAWTGLTPTTTQYAFVVAAVGVGDNDFANPTSASWTSSSSASYTQLSWYQWATGNDGALGIASANIRQTERQQARLVLTVGGVEDRNSVIAVFRTLAQYTTVGSRGNQNAVLKINQTNQNVGGVFTLTPNTGSTSVTSVTITENGTTDAQTDLSNIRLKYELDSTTPYDCASATYDGTETQYGATSSAFSAANGSATFNGSVSVSTTSVMCIFTVLDIDSSATVGHTLELEISTPNTQVTMNQGTATPGTAVTISDTSVLEIGYVPQQPILAATSTFPFYYSTSSVPRIGGFASVDQDSDLLRYEFSIDDDPLFGSPATTTYSSNYPNDAGWASTTFASGATTTYQVASGTLTPGVTYWWRVRAIDPFNRNEWSPYSAARSLTVGSGITVPEWHQTTDYQFATSGTFTNSSTTGIGGVTAVNSSTSVSVLDAWSLGTTKTVSAGTQRLLVVTLFSEDNTTDTNVNEVRYGGQLLTEIYDQQIGTGDSNGLWVGYLNDAGLTSATNTNITVSWIGTLPDSGTIYSSAVFAGVNQSNPIRGYSANALTAGASIAPTASSTVQAGDMAFYAVGAGATRTFTPPSGYTEGTDNSTCAGACAAETAYKAIVANGTELPTATLSSSANRVLMTNAIIRAAAASGTIMSPEIRFNWVSGQTDWGEVSWSVAESGGNSSLMRLYYSSTTACDTLIPNGALSGNSAGFSTTSIPLNISGLSTTTYSRICLNMTLSENNGVTSPTLNDWTVRWDRTPVFTQATYRWYANSASATPTDSWPPGTGGTELGQNEPMTATDPIDYGQEVRLRMGIGVTSVAASNRAFKLQFAESATCSASLSWSDVGGISSSTALWRGYDNGGLTDGATLASTTLSGSTAAETYEEENNTATMPNSIGIGGRGEWDFVLEHQALSGTAYCFRMVNTDGTPFTTYTEYPVLVTNVVPSILSLDSPFDNEKVGSTSPWFYFSGSDPETDSIAYEVEIDDDLDFSSTVVDTNSESNLTDFTNTNAPADKSPFNSGDTIVYKTQATLSSGTTYWWRVRGKDPEGANEYGEWSTPQSFTVVSGTTVSTWFQTTLEQFDTGNFDETEATSTDSVVLSGGSGVGTTTSTVIDFDNGALGNAWGEFSFTDSGATGTITYRIEYNDGDSWELIPDSDLTGNAAGFTSSPVSIIDLDTTTYNEIRLRANFSGSPSALLDWQIEWGYRVSVVTHLSLFDNEKTGTTTPQFTFTTTDPESEDLEYQFSWSTDNTFVTGSSTVNSSTSPGFVDVTSATDTNPFASGHTIRYSMQSGLTNGVTYWWRVRARDPNGSGSYSFWSQPWSFTIDTTATTSTWFQTTEEQFNTDTLLSVYASTSDAVTVNPPGVTTYTFSGITNPSATHIARDFEVDVNDPTDPPTVDEIDTLTTNGTTAGTPNLRTAILGYASDAEASNAQYTALATSDNSRWQITDPGLGDNAVFWASFLVTEDPNDIDELTVTLEGYQAAAVDKAWLGIWRPGSTTPYWQRLDDSQQTSDYNYTGTISSNIDQYLDGSNRVHIMFFNEDDSDSLFVDYVELEVTTGATTEGTITGNPIDFDDGSGPVWGLLLWNDTEPGLSSITYHLEYLAPGDVWTTIPNSALSGNESGFTTPSVSLTGLNTTTYNEIRIVGELDCIISTCPTLNDWTVRWSPGFTISGTAFDYAGTASTTSGTVAVAIDGVLQSGKTGTISNGSWSISNVTVFDGDVITVFVDSASSTDEAVAVTVYDGSPDIPGLRLQKGHLTIGSDDYETVTNANLGLYDFTHDEDIFFDIDSGNDLTMCADTGCGDASIRVLPLNTYAPGSGADVRTHDMRVDGTFTSGANTVRVSGSWDNNATSTMTGSTVIFTATSSTESIDSTGALLGTFNNVTFGETSGTATWTLPFALDVDGSLSVTYGTLARGTTSISIGTNLTTGAAGFWTGIGTTTFDGTNPTTWTDQNTTRQNIGRVVVDGTAKSLFLGSSTTMQSLLIGADDTFDVTTANYQSTIYRDWVVGGTFTARSGTVNMVSTTTNIFITAGGDAFYNLTFSGVGGGWSFTEADLSVLNDVTIATGTVTLPTGTTTIAGSFMNATGTFAHNNGTVLFTGTGAKSVKQSGNGVLNPFYNVSFAGGGTYTFLDSNATTSNDFRISAGTVVFPSGLLSVGGNFQNTAGSFTASPGTVRFYGAQPRTIDTNSSFYTMLFARSSTTSFIDTNITALEDVTISTGTVIFPTGTFTIGGSLTNLGAIAHSSGTVLMNSADTGETIALGNSSLHNLTFSSGSGGWTITENATTTGTTTLSSVGQFTLNSGLTLAVGGVFSNSAVNASTTWAGSTLSLESGTYSINGKTTTGDSYGTLRTKAGTGISMWNSTSSNYLIDSSSYLYSQDHNAVDGSLYIFGAYTRGAGTEYWNYSTDFDGATLTATTSRQANIRFASGASASFSSSTLSLVGSTTASTTIANQGSGTYLVSMNGGTTTALYYGFSDLGSTGLSLLYGTKVTSLSNGRFVPGVAAGTGISVSSTTIDANPGLQVYRVEFSTTTAISATNVTQTDGTPTSYWWFRESVGNIDGEYFDNDTGDPGSVRWDDSSLTITVSGIVYQADGVTPVGAPTCGIGGTPVRIAVENGGTYDGACNGSGVFSIPGVTIIGDPTLTIFLNGAPGGERAVTVTKTATADITDLYLIANRVSIRHEDTSAMTIADMVAYDNGDDSDIQFTAATGSLTVYPDNGLLVLSGKTFSPGGSVTLESGGSGQSYDGTLYLATSSVFTGAGTTTYAIGGSFFAYASSTFIPASSTVYMTATTSGKTITSSSSESIALNNLSFTGVGGGWNLNGNLSLSGNLDLATGTLTGTGNITLTSGSFGGNGLLSLGGGTTTLAVSNTLGGTEAWTFANLVLGTGSTTGTTSKATTATTTVSGTLRIGTGHYFAPYGSIVNLTGSGTVFVESGTFVEATSTVRYGGTSGSNVLSTTYYNLEVNGTGGTPTYTGTGLGIIVSNNLTVGGNANTTFTLDTNDPSFDANGDVTIASGSTLVASNSGTLTVAGSWDNNGTFTSSNGTVTFDGGGTETIAQGSSSFGNVTASGTGAYTLTEPATTTGTFRLVTLGGFTVGSGHSLAVGTTFVNGLGGGATTWTGSTLYLYGGGNYEINGSTTTDSYERLAVGPGTQIRMWNSDAATYDVSSSGSLYSMDHGAVNGDLYVFGSYTKTSGNDYWSYATDFNGTTLSGGNERQVDVRIASGGSVLYQGGGLSIVGVNTATTTIANQGSGSYSMRVGGTASTTMTYYDFANLDSAGLTFSGTPNVVTLSQGSFTVGIASGTAITVGGTAINQNPARTFTGNIFSTSTGGLAFNVTATGTAVSSWRFTNHAGTIDGENYDVDPTGDPGYIVWDDSAALLSISGHVYSDEGTTPSAFCDGSTNITLRVAGLTTYQAACVAGTGLFTFSNVSYSPGDSFVAYIDGETEKGATVSEDPVTSVSDFDIYENRVIARHEGSDPLSIADMAIWDSSDDADIPFTAIDSSPDTLTLPANRKLIVWTNKEFEPGGNVTISGGGGGASYDGTLELMTNAAFDATGAEAHSIGGSLVMGSGATLDDEISTFTFTTGGAGRTIDSNDQSFYNLVLNGAGSWTITNSTLDIGNDLTITQGTVTFPSATTTVAGSFQNTGGSFLANGGWFSFTSSGAETIRMGGGSFGTTTFSGSGSWTYQGGYATTTGNFTILSGTVSAPTGTLAVGGNFVNGSSFTHNSGTLRMLSSAPSTTLFASSSDLGSVTIAGTGTFIFTDATEALTGSLTLLSGTTTLPTSTIAIGGSLISLGGAFIHATGTVLFNSSDTGESITPGNSTFTHLNIAAPSGGYTLTASATTTGNFSLTSATAFTLQSGSTLSVAGTFTNTVGGAGTTWTGTTVRLTSGQNYTVNTKATGGDIYNIIALGNNTDLRLWNSSATTTLEDSVSSLYSQNNGGVNGELYIYGNYARTTGADYWSAVTDFDGAAIASRAVTVRHAAGATSTFSGGTLSMVGTSAATTTITNQGTGTYSLQITGGTLNAQHYAFRNLNEFGLVLSGESTVSSLDSGDYELAVSGGALITVSSTTVLYNASAVISGVKFATTTAITGVNVALVGSTGAAWTFSNHRGNFDGEAFDSDGGDACGSIRWDDSTCLLTEQSAYRWRNDDGGEGVPADEWYDVNWTKRKRITVTNTDATTYTDAVVEVPVQYDSDMQVDFDDLRVTDASGTTTLNFTREVYTASSEATLWVKIPSLTASADTVLYVYYGNGGASYGGVGTTTFAVYDDFEDDNITEYSGDTSLFTVDTTFAYQGTYGLEANNPSDRTTDGIYRTSASSTVSQGQTIRFLQYVDTSAGSGDETCTLFGVQSPGSNNNNYAVCLEQFGVDRVSISENVDDNDTSGTILASTTITYTTGWYEVEIDWTTSNLISVSVYKDDVLVATTSATDSSYTTGGLGFTYWFQNGGWDLYTARAMLTTEPTTTLGYEQVPGGASWAAALNTALSGADIGEVVRPRFLIENTGLTVADQYRLMYAAKGASPSCEAVSSGSYSAVPAQASCGSSPLCMVTSTQFADGAGTTDVLGGEGAFTPGHIVEDPSNTTASISLDADEYTEVEYALTVTVNASSPTYCLRVSDAGTAIDSYAKVAELGLTFAPNISSITFNDGADITLSPGGTTTVYATGTVTDQNGYADIVSATTTMYRSGVGQSCTLNQNNCYIAATSSCSYTNCSGNSCDIVCRADFYYFTDPTDTGSTYDGDSWGALFAVSDQSGLTATQTAPFIEVLTLRALSATNPINYGSLEVNSDTGSTNASTTFANLGNDAIDILIEGTNLTDGLSSSIPVTTQKYATSTFTYSACTFCSSLSASSTSYEVDLAKPTTTVSVTDEVYWGISVPFGVSANAHQGINTFYATGD